MIAGLIAGISFLMKFLPENLALFIGINDIRIQYTEIISFSFFISTSLLLFLCLGFIFKSIKLKYPKWKLKKTSIKNLKELTPEEKGYLVPFIQRDQDEIHAFVDDVIIIKLKRKGIINDFKKTTYVIHGKPYKLHDWVRNYLNRHPDLLNDAKGEPPPTDIHRGTPMDFI